VSGAREAPAKLPAQQPGATLVQAVWVEPRAADQKLASLSGGRERRVQCPGWLLERAAGVAPDKHPLDHGWVDAGRDRDMLDLACG
jgi:hypothetical protein